MIKETILSKEKTFLLLEVNHGYNYAKKIYEQRGEKEESEKIKIQRQLIALEGDSWLTKKTIQPKNKKIYSLNWNFIIDSFIKHFLSKFDETQLEIINEIYFKNNVFKIAKEYLIEFDIKLIKNSKRKEKSLLKPFFEDVFHLAYNHLISEKQEINMKELFDEIILGIGGITQTKLIKKTIKYNPFFLTLAILCGESYRMNTFGSINNSIRQKFPNIFNS